MRSAPGYSPFRRPTESSIELANEVRLVRGTMKKPKMTGRIDMEGLFEAVAQRLLVSIAEGRILWETRNIRDSGAPFEAQFRDFLGARLPATFSVTSGYLFDPKSNCTPQIDCLCRSVGS
jgi:hypothetical protein